MTTGEKIFQLRKKNNISQERLADIIGVTRQAVSNWELDEKIPDIENAIKLAEIFDVSLDYLLTGKPVKGNRTAFVNKYDSLDFVACLGAVTASGLSIVYLVLRAARVIWEYIKCVYIIDWARDFIERPELLDLYNAVIDEMIAIFVLFVVIRIFVKIAKKLNKNSK